MSTTYCLIREMLHEKGWNLTELQKHSGVSRGSLHLHLAHPDKPLTSAIGRDLKRLYHKEVKHPLSDHAVRVLRTLEEFKQELSISHFERHLDSVEVLTRHSLKDDSLSRYEIVGYRFVLARISFERLRYLPRSSTTPSPAQVIDQYVTAHDAALTCVDEKLCPIQKSEKLRILAHKSNINVFVTEFMEHCDEHKRSRSEEVRSRIKKIDLLSSCHLILDNEPWNWMAARNGLVAASILQSEEDCAMFWIRLTESHKSFVDPEYKPVHSEIRSVLEDPDLWWFRAHVLHVTREK